VPAFKKFKDLNITFKPHPITGDLIVTKEDAAIKQSVTNLLLTVRGERPFQSEIGSSLSSLLFEPLDYSIAGLIQIEITNVIEKYEPRIDLLSVTVEPNFDENGFEVSLEFNIKGREDSFPTAINFLLQRTQ